MTDKTTDGTDISLTESGSESERQKPSEQEMLEERSVVSSQVKQFFAGRIGPAPDPLIEKFDPSHITKFLDLAGKNDERTFEDSKADRRYKMAYILIGLLSFGLLTAYMMPIDKELYKQVIQLLIAVGGGFGAGYGYRRLQE